MPLKKSENSSNVQQQQHAGPNTQLTAAHSNDIGLSKYRVRSYGEPFWRCKYSLAGDITLRPPSPTTNKNRKNI